MKTRIGDFLRNLRMNRRQLLKDMAELLGVSSAFLSAVENGKKIVPDSWYSILEKKYDLSENDMDRLREAAMESQKAVSLNIRNSSECNRQLAVSFARKFDDIDEVTSHRIMELLKGVKKGKKEKKNE
ncbi:MAG: helix-turn-helix domain-containing protein [Lachnospiraceae bacterium]|nr:helix-turn-helix domain-containing protein [Lachnospiraceae bacterium]